MKKLADSRQNTSMQKPLRYCLRPLSVLILVIMAFSLSLNNCLAVTSVITRHNSRNDFTKGETEDVVITSKGTLSLALASETLIEQFEPRSTAEPNTTDTSEPWAINSIVISGGSVFIGTSPNGGIYEYSLGKITKIYPLDSEKPKNKKTNLPEQPDSETNNVSDANQPAEANQINKEKEPNKVKAEEHLANEHIFIMATDVAGRLLAGISGKNCRLMRLEGSKMETVFEPNDAKYIFAITVDKGGDIYIGTGPEGKIYRLDPFGKKPELLYDSTDKNILSLAAGRDGFIYAGSDTRGLVYKIDPQKKSATVLYDSEQPEITALLVAENDCLYAAATSAKITQAEAKFASEPFGGGRPDIKIEEKDESAGGLQLKVANTKDGPDGSKSQNKQLLRKPVMPAQASYIYKITEKGFVTDIFTETAVFFCLAEKNGKLIIGTGNDGQLYTVEPASEEEAIVYKDKQAAQITALAISGDDIYLGTANPARLIKLGKNLAKKGTFTSDLIDAGQPANWGKLQIEADIPKECQISVSARSGNVKDVNDPTFSEWSQLQQIVEPVELTCPLGRFCQYKLILESSDTQKSPVVREVAAASTVPNLKPEVEAVSAVRDNKPDKKGFFEIRYKAKDDNKDKLIYKIEFRKVGRIGWIELKDKHDKESFEWDAKTVEDGRYEIKVTANDERSNTAETKLTGSRISDPIVIDNTAPEIRKAVVEKADKQVILKFHVKDEFSAIGQLNYTVDSNKDWIGAIPDDLVYDTTEDNFTIVVEKLDAGEHIIAVRVSDDVGNTAYKTYEVNIADN